MTVQQALHHLDCLHPNAYSREEKIGWLWDCEGQIYNKVFATHLPPPNPPKKDAFSVNPNHTLLVPSPYTGLYHHYLEGQMLYAAGEIGGYNNAMALYNGLLQEFHRFYHARHTPLGQAKSVLS